MINRIKYISSRALFVIALFVFSAEPVFAQFAPVKTRCIWITRESLYNPASIDNALTYAAENNFTRVFIQVRSRGDALYKTDLVHMNENVIQDFDPLAYAIELGHELSLEVHAWMNAYVLWSSPTNPVQKNHLLFVHPEWTEANYFGKMDWRVDTSKPPSPHWEGVYLSPMHPSVNLYLAALIKDVTDHYNVDGIHLDYLRYQDEFYGFNPEGRAKFQELFDIDPMDISRGIISTRFGWEASFVDSITSAWHQFKKDNITQLLQLIRTDLEQYESRIKLSAAVKPNLISAEDRWCQDWPAWLSMGLLDFVVPMNYYKEISFFTQDMKLILEALDPEMQNQVIMGIATYNQDAESAADKVLLARLNGFTGISVFSYDSHRNNLEWLTPVIDALSY